jgi:hypothetical protein
VERQLHRHIITPCSLSKLWQAAAATGETHGGAYRFRTTAWHMSQISSTATVPLKAIRKHRTPFHFPSFLSFFPSCIFHTGLPLCQIFLSHWAPPPPAPSADPPFDGKFVCLALCRPLLNESKGEAYIDLYCRPVGFYCKYSWRPPSWHFALKMEKVMASETSAI